MTDRYVLPGCLPLMFSQANPAKRKRRAFDGEEKSVQPIEIYEILPQKYVESQLSVAKNRKKDLRIDFGDILSVFYGISYLHHRHL